jgi:DNA repair and recombination protein RAD52
MDWEIAKPLLEAKLDPKHVVEPSGSFGPKGSYIQGWHAIAEANRIFGFGGWSYTIKTMTQDALSETDKNGKKQWQAAYTCIVTVTVEGVVREDVGFGSGFAAQIGDAVEGATKEAVTDALKRALRTFGNSFGLALYDKTRANVGAPTAEPKPEMTDDEKRDAMKGAINKAINGDALDTMWNSDRVSQGIASLPPEMQGELAQAYTDRMAQVAH